MMKPMNIQAGAELHHVPLSNLVARGIDAEIPISAMMPITLEYKPHDTVTSALARAIWPLKLAEVGK